MILEIGEPLADEEPTQSMFLAIPLLDKSMAKERVDLLPGHDLDLVGSTRPSRSVGVTMKLILDLVGRGARVIEARRVGADGKHLKLFLSAAGCHFEAIAFGHGQEMSWTQPGCELDMVFSPRMDDYGGLPRLQLVVEELKRAGEV